MDRLWLRSRSLRVKRPDRTGLSNTTFFSCSVVMLQRTKRGSSSLKNRTSCRGLVISTVRAPRSPRPGAYTCAGIAFAVVDGALEGPVMFCDGIRFCEEIEINGKMNGEGPSVCEVFRFSGRDGASELVK